MYKADSDLFAIIWGVLAFALPVLASVFERKKKKQAKEGESVQEVEDEDDMFEGFAFTELFKEEEREEPEGDKPAERYKEQLVNSEDVPAADRIEAVNILGEVESESRSEVSKRVKDNPKDLILFGEIMNPKYKEF